MIIQDPEVLNKIIELRQKCIAGTITIQEMREAIILVRGNRVSAQEAAAKARAGGKSKAPARSADEMLKELGI